VICVESLDEIISHAAYENGESQNIVQKVEAITRLGMAGKIDFRESLIQRISMTKIHKRHIEEISQNISSSITPGMKSIIDFCHTKGMQVFFVSGGFLDVLLPVAKILGISKENCFGNTFLFDDHEYVCGIDEKNPLSTGSGKSVVIESIASRFSPKPITILVGDGANDLRVFEIGKVDFFLGFGKNIVREEVRSKAVHFFYDTPPLQSFLESFFLQ
jgi:HAD superfamily phosphoserine phosphatase-like hydrolase